MSSITSVKSKDRPVSAGQKFWPLKKFGLHHHGKEESTITEPVKDLMEKDAQKKTKNKRLSSLLSSRRQEANIQNLQSHVNTPESIAADTKKQTNHASNTPTLTRKSGRDIVRNRINSQNTTVIPNHKQQYNTMTAKSAGSATLARSNTFSHFTPPCSPTPPLNKLRARELRNSTRRSSEDRFKRPQSPPKRNDSPTQPHIMLESVQQQIQLDQLLLINDDDVDNDSAIEEDDYEDESKKDMMMIPKSANPTKNSILDSETPPIKMTKKRTNVPESFIELKPDTKEEKEEEHQHQQQQQQKQQQVQSPFCSPPLKPAAAAVTGTENLLEFTRDDNSAAGIVNINSEPPISPTMCALDVQSMQQDENKLHELPQSNNLYIQQQQQQQQPIQRINRLRPAASFATLRQLASSNNTFQYQQFSNPQQQQQIPQIKRRPVSFIESGQHVNYASSVASDDYLSVHRPAYYRRASSEDNRQFHIRQQSDTNQYSSRRLVRSNTVHNLIIKDGYGHRIVQCHGLDEQQQQQQQQQDQPPLRRKNSSFESHDSFPHDWSPPTEVMDDSLFLNRPVLEEPYYHQPQQHQMLMIQQQDNTDASSSDSSSHHGSHRRIKRKDSAKSISSLCSTSPPITGSDAKFEKLRSKLEKERATVKALQKQKEAYNKDVLFLSKNVDDLAADNLEWKKKFENEKTLKERFQDDLSSTMDKLSEATEQIRQLESQTRALKSEIDDKNKELRELEKRKPSKYKGPAIEGKSSDRLLAAQLHHSQNQVRLLKSTMEQFLRMGVFNDDLNSSNITSPTTSIDAVVADLKSGKSRPQQRRTHSPGNKSSTTHTPSEEKPNTSAAAAASAATSASAGGITAAAASTTGTSPAISRSRKSLVPTEITETNNTKNTKTPQKKTNTPPEECTEELDAQLRELLREKELLQAEYSKAPSSGGNALVRRRREELESRLDTVDSQMCRIKLKMRSRNIL